MSHLTKASEPQRVSYRPELHLCPVCQTTLKRSHILWRKAVRFSEGIQIVTSWGYRCPRTNCAGSEQTHKSLEAEKLHLKSHQFSRELVVQIGYRRFWQHRTMYEVHDWLTQDLHVEISEREVAYLILDFLALLQAAQPAKIKQKLSDLKALVVGIDGMQPEKGNDSLYIVRELQSGVTLLAKNLEESSQEAISEHIIKPLKELAATLNLTWKGVVSDAQESLRLAVAQDLASTPHQACQSHCLRDAGKLTFEADRSMKKELKASFRKSLTRLRKRVQALPESNPFRPVLQDYTEAMRSNLLEGGVAPFDLGGINVFEALESLETSLLRCQKKPTMSCCAD